MMTRRENVLAFLNHHPHDHVVDYMTDLYGTGANLETFDCGPVGGGEDGFGCKWLASEGAMGAGVPASNSAVLHDVTDWKKIVKFPDLDKFEWEEQAKIQLGKFNSEHQIQEYGMWNGQFLRLTHLMGFEDGLCAMYEEPEACYDLMDAITDYKIKAAEYAVKYFNPDTICAFDDVATERGPFMSPDVYRKLIKPLHKKFNDAVKDMGVIPNMHVCGLCESIVPDFVEEGIHAWEICQPENDLVRLQKQVGDNLAFIGGIDMKGKLSRSETTEEELRAAVREAIDKYAPGGNYGVLGMVMYSDFNQTLSSMMAMSDEAVKYGTNYYNK